MHVKEIRAARLRQLLDAVEGRGKQAKLAKRIKKAPAQISQWINGTRTIEEDTARGIERAAKLPSGWLDEPTTPPATLVDDAAIQATVFHDLMQRMPAADRHLVLTVAHHTLHRNAALFAEEEIARYDAVLNALDHAAGNGKLPN